MTIGQGVSQKRFMEIYCSDTSKDDKNKVLMRDVILKFHPDYVNSKIKNHALNFSHHYNVERLVEESLAYVGGYDRVDESGRDFNCSQNSDSKTSMINHTSLKVEVGSIENKIGALRILVFNPFKDCIDYFYIPASSVDKVARACYGTNKHKSRLVMKYNSSKDKYNMFDVFRMPTFESVAKAQCKETNSKYRDKVWAEYWGFSKPA